MYFLALPLLKLRLQQSERARKLAEERNGKIRQEFVNKIESLQQQLGELDKQR